MQKDKKICSQCEKEKDIKEFYQRYYYKGKLSRTNTEGKVYVNSICKKCEHENRKDDLKIKHENQYKIKPCNNCGEDFKSPLHPFTGRPVQFCCDYCNHLNRNNIDPSYAYGAVLR